MKGIQLLKEKKGKKKELDMLGYPEQMQKPVSINTCKTISSLRTVMPGLNISIPQALPTTQSAMMKQVKKPPKPKTPTTTPVPQCPPLPKRYILQVCGVLFLFLGTRQYKSCIWLQHLESTSKFHLCLVFWNKRKRTRTGFLKKAKNNNVL